jgi:hypothetical protein
VSDERQSGMADFNDLAAVLSHAQKGWTIDFQAAVLASLMRIEALLAPPPMYVVDPNDPALKSLMDKLASSDRRAGAIFRVTDDEMRVMSALRPVDKPHPG